MCYAGRGRRRRLQATEHLCGKKRDDPRKQTEKFVHTGSDTKEKEDTETETDDKTIARQAKTTTENEIQSQEEIQEEQVYFGKEANSLFLFTY